MKFLVTIYILLCSGFVLAQNGILSRSVTLDYSRVRLEEALNDITLRYKVNFSYSKDLINVRQRVSVAVENVPLSTALDKLFESTQVGYSLVGNHIVLKLNNDNRQSNRDGGRQGSKNQSQEDLSLKATTESFNEELVPEEVNRTETEPAIQLSMPPIRKLTSSEKMYSIDEVLLNLEWLKHATEWYISPEGEKKRLIQVSVLPGFGTNTNSSSEITNTASLNLLWGVNGGVEGVEIGGIFNTVEKHMKGVQFAGVGNQVKGSVTGTQIAGVFNSNGASTRGVQLAGLMNRTKSMSGFQFAPLLNWVKEDASGLQVAGIVNSTGRDATALQIAGAINYSAGRARLQVSGLMNIAGDVQTGQISPLINVAQEVKGFQLALINIADTVSGTSVGLLNLVKKGYNKVELYSSESLHGAIQLKLGSNSFYNIFQVGARNFIGSAETLWGFGYGIGTVSTLSAKNTLNYELLAIHINENESFTRKLNSLGQFRLIWSYQVAKNIGLFMGPTANVMFSRLQNIETGELGSTIVPYAIVDEKLDDKTSMKAWIGVNAGFRF